MVTVARGSEALGRHNQMAVAGMDTGIAEGTTVRQRRRIRNAVRCVQRRRNARAAVSGRSRAARQNCWNARR